MRKLAWYGVIREMAVLKAEDGLSLMERHVKQKATNTENQVIVLTVNAR